MHNFCNSTLNSNVQFKILKSKLLSFNEMKRKLALISKTFKCQIKGPFVSVLVVKLFFEMK